MKLAILFIGILFPVFVHAQIITVSPAEFNKLLTDTTYQKLDVRTGLEFELVGHIHGFSNVNMASKDFVAHVVQRFDKHKPLLVTCFSGHRSIDAVRILKDAGFENVIELKGGIIAWMTEGYSLE